MQNNFLVQLGLSENEALVFDFLLKKGKIPAGEIIKNTPLKRGVVYNVLASLKKKELLSEKKENKISLFSPNHPEKLRELLKNKESELRQAENSLSANMSLMVSDFNLVSGKPGIRIFEGKEGLAKVLNDSLDSRTEILTYADIEGMEKYLGRANEKYVYKRKELGIKKRAVIADTPFARKFLQNYDRSVTQIRFVDGKKFPFHLEMEIYDNKVSFMTFSEKSLIGMIIENREIYQTQKSIFEIAWEKAVALEKIIAPKPSRFEAPSQGAK